MATIYDHRPKTAGAGPGASWAEGVGGGVLASQRQTRTKEEHEANMAEAGRREAAYQQESEIMKMRLAEAKDIVGRRDALRGAQREANETFRIPD